MSLAGMKALVTGAGAGIGRATALRLASAGADIVLNDLSTVPEADGVAEQIGRTGRHAVAIKADVSEPEDVKMLVDEAHQVLGRIDILVNNAGIETIQPLFELTVQDWDKVTNTNLKSQWLLSKEVGVLMTARGEGCIINLSSVQARKAVPGRTHYAPTKGAIVTLTQNLALELGAFGIRVNAVAPGLIQTRMTAALMADKPSLVAVLNQIPLGRAGEPDEVAEAVAFPASPAARYITGHTLFVDGGMAIT